jgi:serine/threonine protein kinase/tetratricopeptide (TPR) repeat protein
MTESQPPSRSPEELLFEDALRRRELGEELSLDALCAAHPEHAPALRRLAEAWSVMRRGAPQPQDGEPGGLGGGINLGQSGAEAEANHLYQRLKLTGQRGARYRAPQEIGRGGMGVVLRAWDDELRRPIALKVLKDDRWAFGNARGEPDPRRLSRFLEEAQITGQLDHPAIVPVHEIGLDSEGRPYFSMRLVKGVDLRRVFEMVKTGEDGWNQTRAVGVLLRVCEAMSYAHSKSVIHRDLTPANVMVGKYGEVSVMDWGLARVLTPQADSPAPRAAPIPVTRTLVQTDRTSERETTPSSPGHTHHGDFVGVPSYVAPEQARGALTELGPHTDVYALGAMLYHLLAGHRPYVPSGSDVPDQAVLVAAIQGPPRALGEVAPQAPPELVAICEKAMKRETAARYPTMQALAEDLRAYLEGRVVSAFEAGTWAETRKWVRRNKALATSIAAAIVILALSVVTSTHLAVQAKESASETQEAAAFFGSTLGDTKPDSIAGTIELAQVRELEAALRRSGANEPEIAAAVANLKSALAVVNPTNVAKQVLEQEFLVPMRESIDREFATKPRVRSGLLHSLGETATKLDMKDLAHSAFSTSVELRGPELGELDTATLDSMGALAVVTQARGEFAEAERLMNLVVDARREQLGPNAPETLTAVNDLGSLLRERGEPKLSADLLEDNLRRCRAQLGDTHETTLSTMNNLATAWQSLKRDDDAIELYREALEACRASIGEEDPRALRTMGNLGTAYRGQKRPDAAEPLFERALELTRRLLGDDHSDTLTHMINLATVREDMGKRDEAAILFREAVELSAARHGEDHPLTCSARNNLAGTLFDRNQPNAEVEQLLRSALAGRRKWLGSSNRETLTTLSNLAAVLKVEGRLEESEELAREALEHWRAAQGYEHPETLDAERLLGSVLSARGRFSVAEPLLIHATEASTVTDNAPDDVHTRAITKLIELYDLWHKAEPGAGHERQAARWRAQEDAGDREREDRERREEQKTEIAR